MGSPHASDRKLLKHLAEVLADTYVLGVKTHGAHWNVKGAAFFHLHAVFGEQYQELLAAADVLAERLRALGEKAPASMAQLLKLSSIGEAPGNSSKELVEDLRNDHMAIAQSIQEALVHARKVEDEATGDLLVQRIGAHDKTAWMLTATLDD